MFAPGSYVLRYDTKPSYPYKNLEVNFSYDFLNAVLV